MTSSRKKDFAKSKEVIDKEDLIKSQETTIEEFRRQKTRQDEQEEIHGLKLSTLQIIYSKNQKELTSLEKNISSKRARNSELDQLITDLDHNIAITKDSIDVKNADISELEIKIDQMKRRATEAKNELVGLTEDSKTSTKRLLELESQIKSKNEHILELENQIDSQNKKLVARNEEVEKLFYNLLADQKKESSLKKQRDLNAEKIKSLESEVLKTEKELSTIEANIRSLTSEINVQEKNIDSKKQRVYEQRKEFDRLAALSADKEDIKDTHKIELEELERKLSEVSKDILTKRDQITRDESFIKTQAEDMRLKREEIDGIERSISRLSHEIEEANNKITLNKNSLAADSIKVATLKKQLDELECLDLTNQDDLRTTSETKLLKEREISNLSQDIKALQEKVNTQSIELESATNSVRSLSQGLEELRGQRDKLKNTLEHKVELLEEQNSYLLVLKTDLEEVESELESLREQSALTHEDNEFKKSEIFKYDEKIKENQYHLVKAREEIQSTLEEGKSVDQDLLVRMENLYAEEKRAELVRSDIREYLGGISKDKDKREQAFLSVTASFNSLKRDIEDISTTIRKNKDHISKRTTHIEEKQTQVQDLSQRVSQARERNTQYEKTLTEQNKTLTKITEKVESLQAESIILITKEESQTNEVQKLGQEIERLENHRAKLSEENSEKMALVKKLNKEYEKLQTESLNNHEAIADFRENSKELTKDIQKLESTIADYQAKIKVQKDYYRQNNQTVKGLTNQNQLLIEKIQKLEEVIEDFEAKNSLVSQQLAIQEATKNQNEVKFNNLAHKVSASGADIKEVAELIETGKSLDVDFNQQVRSLQLNLEKKFFNLTIAPILGDTGFVEDFEANQLTVLEEVHNSILTVVEHQLSGNAEIFVSFDVSKTDLKSNVSVSHLEGVTNMEAKKNLLPVTSRLMKKYKDLGLGVSFKVKFKPNGTIDKLKIILSMPLAKDLSEVKDLQE